MFAIQFVISIIYIGSWVTFLFVRIPRVVLGLILTKWKLKIFRSNHGICAMKMDWIVRATTAIIYVVFSFGFSVYLPKNFCELFDVEDANFNECKWQVFGFRLVFILLYLPLEFLALAVVYRNATDMIFKI